MLCYIVSCSPVEEQLWKKKLQCLVEAPSVFQERMFYLRAHMVNKAALSGLSLEEGFMSGKHKRATVGAAALADMLDSVEGSSLHCIPDAVAVRLLRSQLKVDSKYSCDLRKVI